MLSQHECAVSGLGQDMGRAHSLPHEEDHVKTPYGRYTLSSSLKRLKAHPQQEKKDSTYIKVQTIGDSVSIYRTYKK